MSTELRGRGQEQSCQGLSPTLSTRTSLPSRSLERTAKGKESPENRKPRVTQTPGSKKRKFKRMAVDESPENRK